MCGIVGTLNCDGSPVSPDLLLRMTRMLKHRGPDGEGIWVNQNIGFGHRRLSIIDLSDDGKQPMANSHGNVILTFNGEIYNYQELRNELIAKNYIFNSKSDSEVIIHLYEEEGIDCLKRLNGMFAFALWDATNQLLFLARDRLGIKPLFYFFDGRFFRFASEIKGLLADNDIERRVDTQGLHNFLSFNYSTAPLTLFSGIKQLLPAHALSVSKGELREWRYWDVSYPANFPEHPDHYWSSELEETLSESIKRHLVADVPIGMLLSGGVDSSAILALLSKRLDSRPLSFSIGFREHSYNEIKYARQTAKHCKVELHERLAEPHMAHDLPKLVWHSEDPLADPSAIPMYYLAEMVSQQVKVAISGDGADELFAGYETYQADYLGRMYRALPKFLRQGVIEPLTQKIPISYERYSLEMKIKRFVRAANLSPEEAHFSWRLIFDERFKASLKRNGEDCHSTFDQYKELFNRVPRSQFLNRMLYFDTCFHLPNDILTKVDRMSMAHGLEVRVPFLDPEVVQFAAQVPPRLKLRRFHTKKFLLKAAMKNYLPEEVLSRPKAGFNVPLGSWLRNDLRELMCDTLSRESLDRQGLFNTRVVQGLVSDHLKGVKDHGFELWGLMVLMIWWQLFFEKQNASF